MFNIVDLSKFSTDPIPTDMDFWLFLVGLDNVHDLLVNVLSMAEKSLTISMYGYDDEELNKIIIDKMYNKKIKVILTLDKMQAGGLVERKILEEDASINSNIWNNSVVIGRSETGQINHTKGFVVDSLIGGEGSTNWSDKGEGTKHQAQNNTQTIFTNPLIIKRFENRLIEEHIHAKK